MLRNEGHYDWTSEDALQDTAFDMLATLEPFNVADDAAGERTTHPWRAVIEEYRLFSWVRAYVQELESHDDRRSPPESSERAGEVPDSERLKQDQPDGRSAP